MEIWNSESWPLHIPWRLNFKLRTTTSMSDHTLDPDSGIFGITSYGLQGFRPNGGILLRSNSGHSGTPEIGLIQDGSQSSSTTPDPRNTSEYDRRTRSYVSLPNCTILTITIVYLRFTSLLSLLSGAPLQPRTYI